uniref:Uncharacterized protein n=3 Tax=Sinorhizobium saheli TaxID=36856 RepID=D1CTK4_SINSA|nr:hypothetical protein [Sinorhizobium saheli]
MNRVARIIEEFNLPQRSIWWNKANFFSMVCELAF